MAGTHTGNPIVSEWTKRTLLCQWAEATGIDAEYDYIVIDCPPATKIVSQNAIALSHGYIVPVVPEAVMERGALHLANLITTGIGSKLRTLAQFGPQRSMFVPQTQLVGLVITRIQTHRGATGYTNDHAEHLHALQQRWGTQLLTPYIELGTGVSESLTASLPVYDRTHTQNVRGRRFDGQFRTLVDRLKARIDAL